MMAENQGPPCQKMQKENGWAYMVIIMLWIDPTNPQYIPSGRRWGYQGDYNGESLKNFTMRFQPHSLQCNV